jgi:NADH-quinone oxidoreductase subunit B
VYDIWRRTSALSLTMRAVFSEHPRFEGSMRSLLNNVANQLPENFLTTKADAFLAWARKNAIWPYPFGTACCGIEMMAVLGPRYDAARFGAEVVRFSPRQSDLLLVAGTITEKMGPVIRQVYEQMAEPRYVMAMGVCASSGGFYRAYHTMQGVDRVIPVDVYVPGCPPTPEAVLQGILKLQEKIQHRAQVFRGEAETRT